jgi:hypothetical protein
MKKFRERAGRAGLNVQNILLVTDPHIVGDPAEEQKIRDTYLGKFQGFIFAADERQITRELYKYQNTVLLTRSWHSPLQKDKAIAVKLEGEPIEGVLGNAQTQALKLRLATGQVMMPGISEILAGVYQLKLISDIIAQIIRESERTLAVGRSA